MKYAHLVGSRWNICSESIEIVMTRNLLAVNFEKSFRLKVMMITVKG